MEIRIEQYQDCMEEKWDKFIERDSCNGTFLQSRKFLNYHGVGKFEDCSLLVYKGSSTILALIPAHVLYEDGKKVFASHMGSTFGGIVFHRQFYNIAHVAAVLEVLEFYLKEQGFDKLILKQTSQIFSEKNNDLIEYFFFQRNYQYYAEISFVIDLTNYNEDIVSNYTLSRRRGYRHALKNELCLRRLEKSEEIRGFYDVLTDNLQKFGAVPVHTYEELEDLRENRLNGIVDFYGVYKEEKMIAASMVFRFGQEVFHTQYLAALQDELDVFPNNYMDTQLIMLAKQENFHYFSFGISTEEHGRVLNMHLAEFKEGFGSGYCNNKVFYKEL